MQEMRNVVIIVLLVCSWLFTRKVVILKKYTYHSISQQCLWKNLGDDNDDDNNNVDSSNANNNNHDDDTNKSKKSNNNNSYKCFVTVAL